MYVRKTIQYSLFLISTIQIILGAAYVILNISYLPENIRTIEILDIVNTWKIDEYLGVLYPILVWVGIGIEGLIGIPYYSLIYIFQLFFAFFSCKLFIRNLCSKEISSCYVLWASLYIMSIPMVLQCHMSILEKSIANSLFLCFMAILLKSIKYNNQLNIKEYVRLFVCGIGLFITSNQHSIIIFFLFIFLGVIASVRWIKQKQWKYIGIIMVIIFSIAIVGTGINQLTQKSGSRDKAEKSIALDTFKRLMWPYFETDYFFWPLDVKWILSPEEAREYASDIELVDSVFAPLLEKELGQEKAIEYYWLMAFNSLEIRTKEVLGNLCIDLGAHTFPQLSVWLQMNQELVGDNGYNYYRFQYSSPYLAKIYMKYMFLGFFISFLLSMILVCIYQKDGENFLRKDIIFLIFSPLLIQAIQVTWNNSRGMDYTKVLYAAQVYVMMIILIYLEEVVKSRGSEEINDSSSNSSSMYRADNRNAISRTVLDKRV